MKCYSVVDEIGHHYAEGDHDLELAGDTPSDLFGRTLGHVGRCDGRDGSNTNTSNDSSTIDVRQLSSLGGSLDSCADGEQ